MKINSLYISAFGGIKDLRLDFSDGFNVIYGQNENGKTTVMAFIKMMFYGSGRAGAVLSKNLRQKYAPWDGAQAAGSIDFEHGGRRYRLEKEFRSSNSTDKATLCDLDFGTRQAVGSDIGQKFFSLSLSAFERSVFIGQFGFPESDSAAEGELNSRLSNIALTGDEGVSFETVNSRLQKARLALMSKSGRAGEYDKNLKLRSELAGELEKAEEAEADYALKQKSVQEAEQEIAELLKKAEELKIKISAEQDVRNAEKLKKLLELKTSLDGLSAQLALSDGGVADETYLRKLKFCLSKLETATAKAEAKDSEIETFKRSIESSLNPDSTKEKAAKTERQIESLEKEINILKNKSNIKEKELDGLMLEIPEASRRKKAVNIPLLIGSISVFVIAVVLFVLKTALIGAIAVSVALILAVLSFVLRPADKSRLEALNLQIEGKRQEIETIGQELNDKISTASVEKSRLEAIKLALGSTAAMIEKQKELLTEAEGQYLELKEAEKCEMQTLRELFSRYKPYDDEKAEGILSELENEVQKHKTIKTELNYLLNDLGGISYDEAKKKLSEISESQLDLSSNFEQLKENYDSCVAQIADLKAEIASLTAGASVLLKTAEKKETLKQQIKALDVTLNSQKEFCAACDLAERLLLESFAEIRRSYGSVLEKRAGEFLKALTNEKYSAMTVSKSLDIGVEEKGIFGNREIGYLSSGTADQAYLSLRLAIAELICENGELLPILLDDTLAQYDDDRMITALKVLKEYSYNTQVIMFTCHKWISEKAAETGSNPVTLK